MGTCIEIAGLTKRYGSTLAVDGLSLNVQTGEVFGLLGPNGAGKTTTFSILTGLVHPTAGKAAIFGKELRRGFLDIASRTGVLLERPAFYNHLSARRNLLLLSRLGGRKVPVGRMLEQVGLGDVARKKVGTFSMGMRQRLGLAQALLGEPELLILDEPANGLDAEGTREILHLLRRLADDAKVTILMSSHMLHEVEALCDRVAIMNRGRLVACDRTDVFASHDPTQVEVLIERPDEAARLLGETGWVESVNVEAGRMYVKLKGGAAHELTAHLVRAGFQVSGVIPKRRTLQDYFLEVLKP